MTRLRFTTVHALYEAFPEVAGKIKTAPTDQGPIAFLTDLGRADAFEDAVTFCAYLLPRREAVWWACGCVRLLLGDIPQSAAGCLIAAEDWVHEPSEERRQAALALGNAGDANEALTWVAFAAGWSGGAIAPHPKLPTPMPNYMTARAARIAVILGSIRIAPKDRPDAMRSCIADGIKLAQGGL
jgi:hypothetical protein